MPIFISYSHQDKDFVDRLAEQLVRNRVYVWLDRWELHVGDSLTSRIEDAITSASALLVILSTASVESPWVRREINSGLLRELEERRVVVLPVLVDSCTIPLFLRDKIYADFRTNFDDGLRTVLEATARISNPSTGRVEAADYHSDWSLDWGESDGLSQFRLNIIQEAADQPYTILSTLEILANAEATKTYRQLVSAQGEERANTYVINLVVSALNDPDELRIRLTDQFEQVQTYTCATTSGTYGVIVSSRRLGVDNGRDVIFNLGSNLHTLAEEMRSVTAGHSTD